MTRTILGIPFAVTPFAEQLQRALRGGLTVVPSGPGLAVDLRKSADYRRAVTEADLALTDSGAMILFWRLFRKERLARVSGLTFLEAVLQREELRPAGTTFWVHPSAEERRVNEDWLRRKGLELHGEDGYVAPYYPKQDLSDEALWQQLQQRRPKVVVLCIGGGVQERLGWWLREQYRAAGIPCPAILCTGAAIGFLSGNQVNIPDWADRFYLGWFFRCLYEPQKFIPRYWTALPLIWLILRYGAELPPLAMNSR